MAPYRSATALANTSAESVDGSGSSALISENVSLREDLTRIWPAAGTSSRTVDALATRSRTQKGGCGRSGSVIAEDARGFPRTARMAGQEFYTRMTIE